MGETKVADQGPGLPSVEPEVQRRGIPGGQAGLLRQDQPTAAAIIAVGLPGNG
jgi:hypothetical protein